MGKSFFTGTDAELYAGSNLFLDKITLAPTDYGLVAGDATSYGLVNSIFAAAWLVANDPQTRTKGTIKAKDDAAVPLRAAASMLAKRIDGFASVTNEQRIDLGLSVRKTPEPMPAPGTCSNFKVELLGDGSIQQTWKANNPAAMSGVTYQVWRRLGSEGEFSFLGATGEKKFIDSTIPVGTAQAQYQIRGIRPTSAGAWAQFNVNFTTEIGGAMSAMVSPQSAKIAA